MQRIFFLLCVIIGLNFQSCSKLPKGVLSEEKMESVLWDMMRADIYLRSYRVERDSSYNDTVQSIQLYQKVLAINEISKETFLRSLNYYSNNTQLLKPMLDSMVAESRRIEQKKREDKELEIVELDSNKKKEIDTLTNKKPFLLNPVKQVDSISLNKRLYE